MVFFLLNLFDYVSSCLKISIPPLSQVSAAAAFKLYGSGGALPFFVQNLLVPDIENMWLNQGTGATEAVT